jgi:hypothetical protein
VENITQGVLYVASGEAYIRAAMRSALSVRKNCPGLPVHLFADWKNFDFRFSLSPQPFTSVEMIENPHRRSKLDYLTQTPFERTLYLDTDTSVRSDVRDMFRLLERFDLAAAHGYRRNFPPRLSAWRIELPQAFPQLNAGVLLYRKTPAVMRFLEEWRDRYHENYPAIGQDQATLRELIWLSDLRLAVLPPEYNVRYVKYHMLWSRAEARTKIFHLKQYHSGWLLWLLRPVSKTHLGIARRIGLKGILDPKGKKKRKSSA